MIFIPVLLYAIITFFRGKKIISILLYFFFLTNGFQLVPEILFDTYLGINKSIDFAVIYTLSVFIILLLKHGYKIIKPSNNVEKSLCFFLIFYLIVLFVNLLLYKVPIDSIVKNSRYYFLLPIFFIFNRLTTNEINKIKRILFKISIFLSSIFIVQVVISTPLLTGHVGGKMYLGGLTLLRFYNIPILTYYFLFYSIFNNPYTGRKKIISQIILISSFILPMHRGFIASFLVILLIGTYYKQKSVSKTFKTITIFCIFLLPFSGIIIDRFSQSKGNQNIDLIQLINNGIDSYDYDKAVTQTMYFRFAHSIERGMTAASNKMYALFGIGLWTDNDKAAKDYFDFTVHNALLEGEDIDDGDVFFTNDIAWSVFFTQIGFLGMIVYLFFYFYILIFFYKRRNMPIGNTNLMVLLLFLFTSISSVEMITILAMTPTFLDYTKIKKEEKIFQISEMNQSR